MLGFWEVMDRCNSGPLHKEKQFDMQLARAAQKQATAFGIRFDPETVIPEMKGETSSICWTRLSRRTILLSGVLSVGQTSMQISQLVQRSSSTTTWLCPS